MEREKIKPAEERMSECDRRQPIPPLPPPPVPINNVTAWTEELNRLFLAREKGNSYQEERISCTRPRGNISRTPTQNVAMHSSAFYEILKTDVTESVVVELPVYPDDVEVPVAATEVHRGMLPPPIKKWTEEENRLFLKGLEKYADWKRMYVKSRTPLEDQSNQNLLPDPLPNNHNSVTLPDVTKIAASKRKFFLEGHMQRQ